jgi:hypothetical protein
VTVAKQNNLVPVKILVNNSPIHLELFESKNGGNLFLSSSASSPKGTVYYAVTPSLFCAFLENLISLQTMFNASPSIFVEISNDEKTTLYSRNDIDIKLTLGEKKIDQLVKNCPFEVW